MSTLQDMMMEVNAQLPGLPSSMVKDAIARAYRDVCRHWPWSWLQATYNLGTFTPVSTPGYITVDSGGKVVTGVGTTFITSTGLDGTLPSVYRIRINGQDQTYVVARISSETSLTLSSSTPYVGASLTASDAAEYTIYRCVYLLDTEIEVVEGMVGAWALTPTAKEDLDILDPRRQTTGEPTRYCLMPGSRLSVELWPVPSDTYILQYWGLRHPNTLSTLTCKTLIDGDVIVKKALLNLATKYIYLNPAQAKTIGSMVQLWKLDADESMSDLIRQDARVRTERPGMINQLDTPRLSRSLIEYDLEEA